MGSECDGQTANRTTLLGLSYTYRRGETLRGTPKTYCFRIKKTTRVCGLCFITEMILCWETYPLLTCHASHSTDSRTCAMTWCRCGSVALRSPAPARAASARCAIVVREDRPEANDEELAALSTVVSP